MCELLLILFNLVWDNDFAPTYWREGLMVRLFKKRDREDPSIYRGITLLNVVGKLYRRLINNHLLKYLESKDKLHEGQGGFRSGSSCIDNLFSLNQLSEGRMKTGKSKCIFLDIKKAYDTVWRDGLWNKMWDMGINGKMWRVTRSLYVNNRSCIFLEGKSLNFSQLIRGLLKVALCRIHCF